MSPSDALPPVGKPAKGSVGKRKAAEERERRRSSGKSALVRLQEMHAMIEAGTYPNCTTFMKKFGVHRSTVLADLDYLRDTMLLPLANDSSRKGY